MLDARGHDATAPDAVLVLADGRVFRGVGFGARGHVVGEVVFNTAMTGYQEIVSDPSYRGQLVCLTVPEVGNVGCNDDDLESAHAGAGGLIVRSLSPTVSNWRARSDLAGTLASRGVIGIAEVDTRALTRHLRRFGATMGALANDGTALEVLQQAARAAGTMQGRGLAHEVSTRDSYTWREPTLWHAPGDGLRGHVVVIDFGVKRNILRNLVDRGLAVTVMPSTTTAQELLAAAPDGVLLSNGPGDPDALPDVVAQVRALIERAPTLPVFGICLGHQLLSLALGGRTYKLPFGHHGGNHPVRVDAAAMVDVDDGGARPFAVQITSQNHGFAVDAGSLAAAGDVAVTHVNLFDDTVAGLRLKGRPLLGVQYHPEAAPGPHDASPWFDGFATMVAHHRDDARAHAR
ncbi:MAG: glutamine-hydrolyzing carbamoyl-phosphate synthase small subunit [Nannocystaceae bacterium]|nr:glutamine-hydrolyzing carbamoyl-phosphate synthase small subunit [Nannocystaceae bacterium]